jgi:hypothetical protein
MLTHGRNPRNRSSVAPDTGRTLHRFPRRWGRTVLLAAVITGWVLGFASTALAGQINGRIAGGPSTASHLTGDIVPALSIPSPTVFGGEVADAVDLSADNPPVADQGPTASCSSWSLDYYLRGWYAMRDGYYPGTGSTGGFEPMFTYAPYYTGTNFNHGETMYSNLILQATKGLDTRADYSQGDNDQVDQPTGPELANALNYRISGWTDYGNPGGTGMQTLIEQDLTAGTPVAISLIDYPEFDNVNASTNYVVNPPTTGESNRGPHAVFADKYDQTGLWVENSWGTGWGKAGYAELSWAFVNRDVDEVVTIDPITPGSPAGFGLTANQTLYPNEYLSSPDLRYTLILQGDGNLVLYGQNRQALWASNTSGLPVAVATLQGDGNLVLSNGTGGVIWASNSFGHVGAWLNVEDDGDVAIYAPGGPHFDPNPQWWSTGTTVGPAGVTDAQSDRLASNAVLAPNTYLRSANNQYIAVMQGDGNLVVYRANWFAVWASNTNNAPGSHLVMQLNGDLDIVGPTGSTVWSSNTSRLLALATGSNLRMQSNGHLVITDPYGVPLWTT